MSRLAKQSIPLPQGVDLKVEGQKIEVKGPKGTLKHEIPSGISIRKEKDHFFVDAAESILKKDWGLHWALIRNIVEGVSKGFEKRLLLIGVGYKAVLEGSKLDLQVGYSHPTKVDIPSGIQVKVEKDLVVMTGIDKQKLGQFAAVVRGIRPPEPYKGKGIRYEGEYVRKKAGKAKGK